MTEPVIENAEGRDDDRFPPRPERRGYVWVCKADFSTDKWSANEPKVVFKKPCGKYNGAWTTKYTAELDSSQPRWEPKCEHCGRKRQMSTHKTEHGVTKAGFFKKRWEMKVYCMRMNAQIDKENEESDKQMQEWGWMDENGEWVYSGSGSL